MKTLSLVIPCYNEENNIKLFYERCIEVFKNVNFFIEYIFVNDGSSDKTYSVIEDIIEQNNCNSRVIGINFSRNFGKESAMLAGLENVTGDYVSIIDVDLQQNPKYVLDMIKILDLNENIDMVACYQRERNEGIILNNFKKFFYRLINKLSYIEFKMNASDFRTFRKSVCDSIISLQEYHRFSKGIFSWIGYNTEFIPYDVENRNSGETSWSFLKLMNYAITGIVSFSIKPLKISTYLGLIMSSFSFLYLIVVIYQKIFNKQNIPGYATIISLILITSGLQMLILGVLGEYLSQVFIQVKNRPKYIIKDIKISKNNNNLY